VFLAIAGKGVNERENSHFAIRERVFFYFGVCWFPRLRIEDFCASNCLFSRRRGACPIARIALVSFRLKAVGVNSRASLSCVIDLP